ncbi:Rqc2 family fibronectin-binding protein [Paenibacillus sinopodophylli]|uniref:Rqc2 family fibronectin-binding protein n=1 Tax=Paenibacillus sinopodophylli TaxID=1837342 RepID=UPI00110D1D69|nr:NFACT RNA binding domain-containing protein [Paenibacillus sinopodophylli]
MALDGIVTHAITQDLQRCVGARIHKIHQPTNHELVLTIRGAGQGKLLLSANPTYPRVHWTTGTYVNPMEAPMFCMLLRKHCEGGMIESIKQVGRERIILIEVKHRDELGDLSNKTIVVEIMGRHSNIILMDPASGMIHDGIHHVTPAISSHRIVLPGSTYTPPPEQGKIDPLVIDTKQAFLDVLSDTDVGAPLYKRMVDKLSGFSPLLAKEIVHRAAVEDSSPQALSAVWSSYSTFIQQVKDNQFTPTIKTNPDTGKSFFSITELTHIEGEAVLFPDISACLEGFYGNKAERDTVKQRAADLIRFVQNEKAKNVTKIKKLEDTLVEAKDAEKYRVLGELLTAYMHQIQRGDTFATLINFYDEEQATVRIELDPQLTPSDNAQRYFRRYTKHKNSLSIVAEQMDIARTEIQYFESLLQQVDNASLGDIGEIRDELVEQGYMKERGRRGSKKKKVLKPTLLCYTSSEGAAIFVGKNNTQNEYLTNRLASSSDTWLHTKDIPGSHVVIRGSDFGNATLEEAAMLSAHYSQARASSSIPVDYTTIRHVRKPNGAKPGFVIYDNQKTLFVTPDEQRIKSLACVLK